KAEGTCLQQREIHVLDREKYHTKAEWALDRGLQNYAKQRMQMNLVFGYSEPQAEGGPDK
ncbi:MAG TPA: hypothetical protein VGT82_04370, partial [Ktedonobacteraceae bacterium]|nr:hypothetical protein [Ktedonobacteraceae bacterium]